jgi:dipicolinate synthase subunit B
MPLKGKRIGFGLTGSHCTYEAVLPEIKKLVDAGAEVLPVITYTLKNTDTRFGEGEE